MWELQRETGVFLPLSFIEYTTVLPVLHRVIANKAFDGAFNQRNLAGGQPFDADHGTDYSTFIPKAFFTLSREFANASSAAISSSGILLNFFIN